MNSLLYNKVFEVRMNIYKEELMMVIFYPYDIGDDPETT
jgi:hypothetical protein